MLVDRLLDMAHLTWGKGGERTERDDTNGLEYSIIE